MTEVELLKQLESKGCSFIIDVPSVGGFESKLLSPEQAIRLLSDKESVYGEAMGLSKADYVEWHASQGSVYCSELTAAGKRCRNMVVRGTGLRSKEWLKLRDSGGYCKTHGG
ncbi:hypothetical protein QU487_06485 [Crenobacter sp. SG2305]|uniref:hypothetical protein n=1 Tax=Crenobacter oryzisoli TaxID=3056844 RepID=UPI0025AA703C|nr:hypothetical protein [Crenobacter sp. SG2305]MDN0082400.1 hypothetical protein [Crenobacter sp. SG2305]